MSQTKLSVNINKFAVLRNSRGHNNPNVVKAAIDAQVFGADGVTVHPRPDERHIKYSDARDVKKVITTEYNIEGNPQEQKFIDLVLELKPTQVTMVPDAVGQITSNFGWDTIKNKDFLIAMVSLFKKEGIRTSIFLNPDVDIVMGAKETGVDRIELYTEDYANSYSANREQAIAPYILAAEKANELGLGINAGHDLDLNNLKYFVQNIPGLLEVSIGHALVCDALYMGYEKTIQLYKAELH